MALDKGELGELVQLISQRVGRCLERWGLLEQDAGGYAKNISHKNAAFIGFS
jgi:hypothetical protein